MDNTVHQKQPVFQFQRPSEGVVYFTIENLCKETEGQVVMPLAQLARHCGLSVSTTNRAVLALTKRGLIQYRRGYNQTRPSIFGLPETGETISESTPARRTIGTPNPIDSDPVIIYTGDIDIGNTVHKHHAESESEPVDNLAYRVADGLDDMKNLALYRNYCRRFPTDVILKAFVRAREVSPHKIKKSRGALFNYLCTQMYANHRTTTNHSGDSARKPENGYRHF
jgi:hypothetical protein